MKYKDSDFEDTLLVTISNRMHKEMRHKLFVNQYKDGWKEMTRGGERQLTWRILQRLLRLTLDKARVMPMASDENKYGGGYMPVGDEDDLTDLPGPGSDENVRMKVEWHR